LTNEPLYHASKKKEFHPVALLSTTPRKETAMNDSQKISINQVLQTAAAVPNKPVQTAPPVEWTPGMTPPTTSAMEAARQAKK
jgi:hypothetical protein